MGRSKYEWIDENVVSKACRIEISDVPYFLIVILCEK